MEPSGPLQACNGIAFLRQKMTLHRYFLIALQRQTTVGSHSHLE